MESMGLTVDGIAASVASSIIGRCTSSSRRRFYTPMIIKPAKIMILVIGTVIMFKCVRQLK